MPIIHRDLDARGRQLDEGRGRPLRRHGSVAGIPRHPALPGWLRALPGISDRPEQLAEVVKAAREAGATGVWTNLLFLRPGTREHFLEHLAQDWPELLPRYEELYRGRAYLGSAEAKPIRRQVSALAREHGVADRRVRPLAPAPQPEQLELAV